MNLILIRQAVVVPLGALLAAMLFALFQPDYVSLAQHLSELTLLDQPIAYVVRAAAILTGSSMLLFGIGVVAARTPRLWFTALAAVIGGASMISNGVYVMGSPLHGLYGIGFFMVLVPAFFAAEACRADDATCAWMRRLSMAMAAFNLLYFWMMIAGLDPEGWHGLTQRLFMVVSFGWYSVAAWWLVRDTSVLAANIRVPAA